MSQVLHADDTTVHQLAPTGAIVKHDAKMFEKPPIFRPKCRTSGACAPSRGELTVEQFATMQAKQAKQAKQGRSL
ncbi:MULTISPECIES: hypothetical protein [unclassified Variovorax]|uniref:hypothetical protein n=1 Tax=unclassified Variovorax TaxID=663243 RepID=UPI001BD3A791|nr:MULTISPECIES: hypothetical protein [unclassified Variovorax]